MLWAGLCAALPAASGAAALRSTALPIPAWAIETARCSPAAYTLEETHPPPSTAP